jgi:hypothetical protein
MEEFRPPLFFRDRMIAGRFRTFEHDHAFDTLPGGTIRMHDEIRFTMNWGFFGILVGSASHCSAHSNASAPPVCSAQADRRVR